MHGNATTKHHIIIIFETRSCHVTQADLELSPPASAPHMPRIQAWASVPGFKMFCCCVLIFGARSSLKLDLQARMTLNLCFSCLHLLTCDYRCVSSRLVYSCVADGAPRLCTCNLLRCSRSPFPTLIHYSSLLFECVTSACERRCVCANVHAWRTDDSW